MRVISFLGAAFAVLLALAAPASAQVLVTSASTASGNATLTFASVPSWVQSAMVIQDLTTGAAIPYQDTVSTLTGTTIVLSTPTGATVNSGDTILLLSIPTSTSINSLPAYSAGAPPLGTEVVPVGTVAGGATGYGMLSFEAALAAKKYQLETVTVGFSYTFTGNYTKVSLHSTGAITTGTNTITFPAAPVDQQTVEIVSDQNISPVTLIPTAGATIQGSITSLTANVAVKWQYEITGCSGSPCYVPD